MRDSSIDYMKGVAVLLMVIVHPLMMMTNRGIDDTQIFLANVGILLTQPIAGLFLFALGYAMALKQRSPVRVAGRVIQTLFIAIGFGVMLKLITGEFVFSILFTATIVVAAVGFFCSFLSSRTCLYVLACSLIAVASLPLLSMKDFPVAITSALFLHTPSGEGWLAWNAPIDPFLIAGMYGGMCALARQEAGWLSRLPHISLLASGVMAGFVSILQDASPYPTLIIILAFLAPALLSYARGSCPIAARTMSRVGRKVTFIYFLHHILIAAVCVVVAGTPFSYERFFAFGGEGGYISPPIIMGTISLLVATSIFLTMDWRTQK